jgi:hypothetical protein
MSNKIVLTKGQEFIYLRNPKYPNDFEGSFGKVLKGSKHFQHSALYSDQYKLQYKRTNETAIIIVDGVEYLGPVFEYTGIRQILYGKKSKKKKHREMELTLA